MKNIIYSFIIVLFVFAACHPKSVPVITARTEEPPPPVKSTPVFTSPAIKAGRLVYTTKCTRCHNAKPVQRWTVEEWTPILQSMIPKAKLDSTQSAQVRFYVEALAKK